MREREREDGYLTPVVIKMITLGIQIRNECDEEVKYMRQNKGKVNTKEEQEEGEEGEENEAVRGEEKR